MFDTGFPASFSHIHWPKERQYGNTGEMFRGHGRQRNGRSAVQKTFYSVGSGGSPLCSSPEVSSFLVTLALCGDRSVEEPPLAASPSESDDDVNEQNSLDSSVLECSCESSARWSAAMSSAQHSISALKLSGGSVGDIIASMKSSIKDLPSGLGAVYDCTSFLVKLSTGGGSTASSPSVSPIAVGASRLPSSSAAIVIVLSVSSDTLSADSVSAASTSSNCIESSPESPSTGRVTS